MAHFLLNPSNDDRRVLLAVEAELHSQGAASHVTVRGLLQGWNRLADQAADYDDSVDEYVNELGARDILSSLLLMLPEPLRSGAEADIATADQRFRSSTVPDEQALLARYFRIDHRNGWWWRRIPATGNLAAYLRQE